ncbi:MAG: beta-lactamase family protein [Lentisphaeraceae bacterium]|nr:beta-lactamase family protein [Lentisphaeraceae bacterium]
MTHRARLLSLLFFLLLQGAFADDFSKFLEKTRKKYKLPAIAAAATLNGQIVLAEATGIRAYGKNDTVTVDDKFHLGSCTKSMTATLAGILVDSGGISWDTTVAQSFPELQGIIHDQFKDVTLLQLLSHTGGVPSIPTANKTLWLKLWTNRLTKSPQEQREVLIRGVLSQKPAYKPGKKFIYSNSGVAIAGMMLEKASGMSWEELLKEKIGKPLNMSTLGFGDMATPGQVDQPYSHIFKKNKPVYIDPRFKSDNPAAIAPAGTVHCSIKDFANFTTVYALSGGDFLSQSSFKKITSPIKNSFVLGFVVAQRKWGGEVLTHTGSNTQNFAVMWISPKRKFSVVVTTNIDSDKARKATDLVCAELIKKFLLKN